MRTLTAMNFHIPTGLPLLSELTQHMHIPNRRLERNAIGGILSDHANLLRVGKIRPWLGKKPKTCDSISNCKIDQPANLCRINFFREKIIILQVYNMRGRNLIKRLKQIARPFAIFANCKCGNTKIFVVLEIGNQINWIGAIWPISKKQRKKWLPNIGETIKGRN